MTVSQTDGLERSRSCERAIIAAAMIARSESPYAVGDGANAHRRTGALRIYGRRPSDPSEHEQGCRQVGAVVLARPFPSR
jgi:hypothetical protein